MPRAVPVAPTADPRVRVSCVCLGNIRRSPMAAAILRARAAAAGLPIVVASAGTAGWHTGRPAHPATVAELTARGIPSAHAARTFHAAEFADLDLILAMDHTHLAHLDGLAPSATARAKLHLIRDVDTVRPARPRGPRPVRRRTGVLPGGLRGARRGLPGPARADLRRRAAALDLRTRGPPVSGEPFEEDAEAWSGDAAFLDDEVASAMTGFFMLVRLEPRDLALARIGVEAVVRSLRDSDGPDAPTLGMMGVPTLIADALTRAALADASPSAREALGELERVVVAMGPAATAEAAERIRTAIRIANARLAGGGAARGAGAA